MKKDKKPKDKMSSNLRATSYRDVKIEAKMKMISDTTITFILFDIVDTMNILNLKTSEINFYDLINPNSINNVNLYLLSLFGKDKTDTYSKLKTVIELVDIETSKPINYKFEFTPYDDIFTVIIKPIISGSLSFRHFRHNIRSNIVSSILNTEELMKKYLDKDEFIRINTNTIELLKESLLLFDQEHLDSIPTPTEPLDNVYVESYGAQNFNEEQKFVKVFHGQEERSISNASDLINELCTYSYIIREIRKFSKDMQIYLCKLPILSQDILNQIITTVSKYEILENEIYKTVFTFNNNIIHLNSVEIATEAVILNNMFDEEFIRKINLLLNNSYKTIMIVDDSFTNIKILSHSVYKLCQKTKTKGIFDNYNGNLWMSSDYFIIDIIDDVAFIFLSNGQIAKTFIEMIHVNILITDIEMPKMNGIELIKFTIENNYNMKIAIQSALDKHLIFELYPEISEEIKIIHKRSHHSVINDILTSLIIN